jgi:predicted DCC family thiol-disulfide oxidoreductase YuxK
MSTSLAHPTEWVLYDGACGICSRWVPRWSATLARRGIEVAPIQSRWVAERTGLAPAALLTDVRLLHPDGRLTSGAEVYRYLLRRIWWLRPLHLLSVTPGFRTLFDRAYRSVARHRHRISAHCGLG